MTEAKSKRMTAYLLSVMRGIPTGETGTSHMDLPIDNKEAAFMEFFVKKAKNQSIDTSDRETFAAFIDACADEYGFDIEAHLAPLYEKAAAKQAAYEKQQQAENDNDIQIIKDCIAVLRGNGYIVQDESGSDRPSVTIGDPQTGNLLLTVFTVTHPQVAELRQIADSLPKIAQTDESGTRKLKTAAVAGIAQKTAAAPKMDAAPKTDAAPKMGAAPKTGAVPKTAAAPNNETLMGIRG